MNKITEFGDKSITKAGDPISTNDQALDVLKSRVDLSYHFFDGVDISNAVSRQSLFHGVLFRNCKITDTDFSRSDFEGARFENCVLTNVSFETADIRSTKFTKTILASTTMRSTVCSDNFFKDCSLLECEFEGASIIRCIFENSCIKEIQNRAATWLHNTFTKSLLEQFKFSDCTASYSIYDLCTFSEVTINADAVGLSFGLNKQDLENLHFGFLGHNYYSGDTPSLEEFLQQYKKRNWTFHALILSLNFKPENTQTLLFALLDEIASKLKNNTGAKHDDLDFLFRVMTFLRSKQQLPFSSVIFAHDLFSKIENDLERATTESKIAELGHQKALYLANSMYNDLLDSTSCILDKDQHKKVEAKITYNKKPETQTLEYVDNIVKLLDAKKDDTYLIEAREGSWIELVQISLGSLFALYVGLYLVNGCLAQMTMVRARSGKLIAKRLPPKFLRAASDPAHELPKAYQDILQKLLQSQVNGDTKAIEALKSLSVKDVEGMIIELKELNT